VQVLTLFVGAAIAAQSAVSAATAPARPPTGVLRVTFLGTGGGPAASVDLAGPSSLVEFGDEVLLIDAGRGAVQRLQQLNRSPGAITRVFLTHLHSDHTVGLPEVWLSGWWRGRAAPLEMRGPAGTREMASHLQEAYSYDVGIRSGPPENLRRDTAALTGFDVSEGVVYEHNGVTVTAIAVDHGPVKCFGYRIDAGGHSVVFSGDDRASDNLVARAQNVDVLVHNMSGFTPEQLAQQNAAGDRMRAALQLLGTPEQAGEVFTRTHCKLAVYIHYARDKAQVERTRATYKGPLEPADDLMRIDIGDQVLVTRR